MASHIASILLNAQLPAPVGDVLWADADWSAISETPSTPITLDAARELVSKLDDSQRGVFAARVPAPEVLEVLSLELNDGAFDAAVVINPYASRKTLERFASGPSEALKETASQRLRRVEKLSGVTSDNAPAALEIIRRANEVGVIADEIVSGSELGKGLLFVLASIETPMVSVKEEDAQKKMDELNEKFRDALNYRSRVLSLVKTLDPTVHEMTLAALLGLNGEREKALAVDTYIAKWLAESGDELALAAEAVLVPERGAAYSPVAPEFARRITPSARGVFRRHDTLWDLVASKRTRVATFDELPANFRGATTTYDQLTMFKLSGLDATQIAGFVFNTLFPMTPAELADVLDDADVYTLRTLIGGEHPRGLTKGQTKALLEQTDEDTILEMVEYWSDKERIEHVSNMFWFHEILVSIPRSAVLGSDGARAYAYSSYAEEELGSDPAAWAKLIELSYSWTDSFASLVEAAKN